jgi:hypothetical protein
MESAQWRSVLLMAESEARGRAEQIETVLSDISTCVHTVVHFTTVMIAVTNDLCACDGWAVSSLFFV